MADVFTREKRSEIMSRIRSRGTAPELRLYALIREILGPRWRVHLNVRGLPGQPDAMIPRLRLIIFADGCFYHNCPRHGHHPKSNRSYWDPKLVRNVRRDAANRRKLRMLGYSVWRFWEHDFKNPTIARTFRLLERRLDRILANRQGGKVTRPLPLRAR